MNSTDYAFRPETVVPDPGAVEKASVSHEEAIYRASLTEEEKVIERKLRVRIDSLIMPLVVLVYLLNYIDR